MRLSVLFTAILSTTLLLSGCPKQQEQTNTDQASSTQAGASAPAVISDTVATSISSKSLPIDASTNALMDQLYGKNQYWGKHQCWLSILMVEEEVQTYCMRPLGVNQVTVGKDTLLYLQTTGDAKNDDPEATDTEDFSTAHVTSGAVGAFILETGDAQPQLLASMPVEQFGAWGTGPSEPLRFVQLSNKGEFGWLGESSYTNHGVTSSFVFLFIRTGKEIKFASGNLPSSFDDSGASYDGPEYDKNKYKIKTYSYDFDSSKEQNGFYPIQITESIEQSGEKKTAKRQFFAYFDPEKKAYECTDKSCLEDDEER